MKKAITLNHETAVLMNERFEQAIENNDPLAFTVGGVESFSGYCGNILREWVRRTSCNCREMQENNEIVSWVCPEHGTQEK